MEILLVPSKELLAGSPELAQLWKRGPLGPWDDLPAQLSVSVPVSTSLTSAQLQVTYLLSEQDALQHGHIMAGNAVALCSEAAIAHEVAQVRLVIPGDTYRDIFSATSPEVRLGRMDAAKAALEARHAAEVALARGRALAGAQHALAVMQEMGFATYRISPEGHRQLASLWDARRPSSAAAPVKAGVFPPRRKATHAYLLECASVIDPAKGFPKQGRMNDNDYCFGAAATIIGCYLLEEERRYGPSAASVVSEKVHAAWCSILHDLAAYLPGSIETRATYVFDAIPALVALRERTDKPVGRGDSISGLSRCSADELINFIDWAKRAK